ncbi:hypothetical protein QVD17_29553 [Tagetes erecta]|uniref:Uncharacterized protein n=1 Tax=Tagetes erecta TaxID=13708 RepID=A0AAD8K3X0_TARER|nr:hypothetical protein QVD17_29553 [Tagetes erecta]
MAISSDHIGITKASKLINQNYDVFAVCESSSLVRLHFFNTPLLPTTITKNNAHPYDQQAHRKASHRL